MSTTTQPTPSSLGHKIAQLLLVVVIALISGAIWWGLTAAKPEVEPEDRVKIAPLVTTHTVEFGSEQIQVPSQGTVRPHREIQLVPQVTGKIIRVSDSLVEGGSFAAGEELLAIDDRDYELAVVQQEAELARTQTLLTQEQAQRDASLREWAMRHGEEPAPPLVRREPQLKQAQAELERANALLDQARLNLERCSLKAPFDGRVRSRNADIGQYVVAGQGLATLFATDWFELVLPVPDDELAFLDLPRPGADDAGRAQVALLAQFGDLQVEYRGCLDRTGGVIDERTRQVPLIVRVEDPLGQKGASEGEAGPRPPLQVGMFLQGRIAGRTLDNVARIPRGALRGGDQVLVVRENGTLTFRQVQVIRRERDHVLVSEGVTDGEVLCLTDLEATEGMRVRTEVEFAGELLEGEPQTRDAGLGPMGHGTLGDAAPGDGASKGGKQATPDAPDHAKPDSSHQTPKSTGGIEK